MADRNFCVKWFLLAIAKRLGFFIIRHRLKEGVYRPLRG
jgi:hypothetical protein